MATTIEVNDLSDIVEHLQELYTPFGRAVEAVQVVKSGYDNRNVLQRLEGESDFTVVGMTNGPIPLPH